MYDRLHSLARVTGAAALMSGCADPGPAAIPEDPLVVPLAWYADAGASDWDTARVGLWWALSNLGAVPPTDEGALVLSSEDAEEVHFTLDLGAVGLPEARLPDVTAAVAPLRVWAADHGDVDVAALLLATLYEPGRYYAITGACATLDEWRSVRGSPDALDYAVTVSLLVPGDRLVSLNPAARDVPGAGDAGLASAIDGLGWEAAEGEGSLADGSFLAEEHETVDVMDNGQQRYAVYGGDGGLRAAGTASAAGQPGKCMWCHEMNVQRGTSENPTVDGYLSYAEFAEEVEAAEVVMRAAREREPSVVDWGDVSAHEHAEWLTLAYLEPTPERVAREWSTTDAAVRAEDLPTHTNPEFPDSGERLLRADVDGARERREGAWRAPAVAPSDRELDAERALVGAEALGCEAR